MALARRVLPPPKRIWMLEAPAGEWSHGPLVVTGLSLCEKLIEKGYLDANAYLRCMPANWLTYEPQGLTLYS